MKDENHDPTSFSRDVVSGARTPLGPGTQLLSTSDTSPDGTGWESGR